MKSFICTLPQDQGLGNFWSKLRLFYDFNKALAMVVV